VTCTFSLILSLRHRITHLCKYWLNIVLQEKLCLKLMCNIEINQNCHYCHNHIIIYHHYWLHCHWKTTIECSDDVTVMLFDASCVIQKCVLWLGMTFCWVLIEYNIYINIITSVVECAHISSITPTSYKLCDWKLCHIYLRTVFFLYSCYILIFYIHFVLKIKLQPLYTWSKGCTNF